MNRLIVLHSIRTLFVAMALSITMLVGGCENVSLGDRLPALEDEAPLSMAVVDALSRNGELGRFNIRVKSLSEDTVRLSGLVDNDAQRAAAEQVAGRVPGVRSVVNTIYPRDR